MPRSGVRGFFPRSQLPTRTPRDAARRYLVGRSADATLSALRAKHGTGSLSATPRRVVYATRAFGIRAVTEAIGYPYCAKCTHWHAPGGPCETRAFGVRAVTEVIGYPYCAKCTHWHAPGGPCETRTRKRRRSRRADEIPHIADLMFRDTVTARMLRFLCEVGSMTQADFMREYHELSERLPRPCAACRGTGGPVLFTCARCKGTGQEAKSRSSFVDNFGRFVHRISWGARGHNGKPYAVMTQENILRDDGSFSPRNMLRWGAPLSPLILRGASDSRIDAAFAAMERQMLAPSKIDNEQEIARWVVRLTDEI